MDISGIWYDPSKTGCGFIIRDVEAAVAGYFFGFKKDGSPLWLSFSDGDREARQFDLFRFETDVPGFPVGPSGATPVKCGSVSISEGDGNSLTVEMKVDYKLVNGPLDFSPPAPDGTLVRVLFNAVRLT